MEDIALALGVSKVTVSRALNGKEGVGEELREKIVSKANEMGYQMNVFASALRTNKMHSVGILISERYFGEGDFFYLEIYKHMGIDLTKKGYTSSFHILTQEEENDLIIPKMITDGIVDGVLLLGEMHKDYISTIDKFEIPKLFVDYYNSQFRHIDSVLTDNYFSFYNFTNDIIKEGYKNISFVGTIKATASIMDRYMGYQKAMIENNLESYIKQYEDRPEDESFIFVDVDDQALPEVFMCNCDYTAYILLDALKEKGLFVPKDVKIVGFDDTLYSRLSSPTITTKHVDLEQIARTSIKFIVKKIENKSKKYGRVIVDTKRIDRESFVFNSKTK